MDGSRKAKPFGGGRGGDAAISGERAEKERGRLSGGMGNGAKLESGGAGGNPDEQHRPHGARSLTARSGGRPTPSHPSRP